MKIVKPDYYKDFRCIAGACPDSCCQGWEVDADEESLAYYSTLNPELEIRKRIDSVLDKDEFGNVIFTLAPKKRCPFLNDENLCDMHIAIGGEHTPFTCRNFPRFTHNYGGLREIGVSFSCPVAADLIYNNGRISFEEEQTDELPTLNEIDAFTFFNLKKKRAEILSLIQSDGLTVKEKMLRLLDMYDDGEKSDETPFFDVFKNPELINPEWEEKLENAEIKPISDVQPNENIMVYFIFKYFLDALEDGDELSKIKMAVIGVLINTFFGEGDWTVHLWSKETEHSQYNMDRYKKLLKEARSLSKDSLKSLIESA